MAADESFVLDGLDLSSLASPLGIREANVDPPAPRYMWAGSVDSEAELLVNDPLYENRVITLKVQVQPQSTMNLALAQIVLVRDKLKKASATKGGIPLVWTPSTSTLSCTFDVFAGHIEGMPIDWESGWLVKAPTIVVRMICAPYWRGVEVLTSTASSGTTPFAVLEIPNVPGDIAARGRVIVTDSASQARRHVEFGLEGPATYNAATSLLVESDNLVTSGFAGTQTTATGAYDVGGGNTTVTCTLVPDGTTAVCGTGNLSHVGAFRVKARIQSGSLSNLFRLAWRAGDEPMSRNPWASPLSASGWTEIDMGIIQIPAATLGTQRWTGQVEVLGAASSPGVALVDYLVLVPVLEGYGVARAEYGYAPGVIVGYDQFVGTTATAALNARVAPAGGTWATSGDATDFTFWDNFAVSPPDNLEAVRRTTTVAETAGRFAILGSTNYTDVEVSTRARVNTGDGVSQGLIARWTDASNHLRIVVPTGTGAGATRIEQVVAGVVTVLASSTFARAASSFDPYLLRLVVFASGQVVAHVVSDAGGILAELVALSSVLATGGTLQTGKVGLYDRNVTGAIGVDRSFTAFTVGTPTAEPIAIYSGQSLEFRWDDTLREDSTGTYYGRPKSYEGTRVTIPVGTSRVLVKARRADIEANGVLDDNVTDATTIQVGYTPRGLVVPR